MGASAAASIRGDTGPLPLFVCGTARSGTSMFVRLLDAHPGLAVLPTETQVYSALTRPAIRRALFLAHRFAPVWFIRALAHEPLAALVFQGRSALAERLAVWSREYPGGEKAPLMANALAAVRGPADYWHAFLQLHCLLTNTTLADKAYWVEKTPLSERFVPATEVWCGKSSRYLHMLRDPRAMIASALLRAHELNPRWPRLHALIHLCYVWSASVGWCRRNLQLCAGRYHALRYEDLVAEPRAVLTELCSVLRLPPHEALLTPTVLGVPVRANSSYTDVTATDTIVATQLQRYRQVLSDQEIALVEQLLAGQMAWCGYESGSVRAATERFSVSALPHEVRQHARSWLKARITVAVQRRYAGERVPLFHG